VANEQSDFRKLLEEAPAVPDVDTLTVVGFLGRTADPARFVLTLPDGRSETLDVAAVKSAKKVASTIGQAVIELELDAKRVPEGLRDRLIPGPNHNKVVVDTRSIAWLEPPPKAINDMPHWKPPIVDTWVTGVADAVRIPTQPDLGGFAPFVAAAPHQVDPATFAALSHPTHRTHQHKIIKPPQLDPQVPPKSPAQDGTNWMNPNAFDITGLGGFDVITYHDGNPNYHYYAS
jgi:hypothetical protein